MTLTGPQKYPGADYKSQWFQDDFGSSKMETNVVVVHTTETPTFPGYSGGSNAPNLTGLPDGKQLQFRQHFDIDRSSRALVNLAGGVETNTLNSMQIELVGTCAKSYWNTWHKRYPNLVYWDDPPEYAIRDLHNLAEWLQEHHDVPMESPGLTWLPYPDSYSNNNGQRMTFKQWLNFRGWCGHEHVPENLHGDPGKFPILRVFNYSGDSSPEPAQPIVWMEKDDEYRVDITLPVYGRSAPHVDSPKLTDALAIGSIIYATDITTRSDGDWIRSKFGTCFKVSSLTFLGDDIPTEPAPDPDLGATEYTVLPGDTLNSIASRHGLTLAQLLALNGLDIIMPGLVLIVSDTLDPEPVPTPVRQTVTLVTINHNAAGYNKTQGLGKGNLSESEQDRESVKRVPALAKSYLVHNPDVIWLEECSNAMLNAMDKALPIYYRAPNCGDGRESYLHRERIHYSHSALQEIKTELNGDNKPFGLVHFSKDGIQFAGAVGHLENQDGIDNKSKLDADTIRPMQGLEVLAGLRSWSSQWDILEKCLSVDMDGNSNTWVRQAYEAEGFVSAAKKALEKVNNEYKTHNNWKNPVLASEPGDHFDLTMLPDDDDVVIESWIQVLDHEDSDHHVTVTRRTITI